MRILLLLFLSLASVTITPRAWSDAFLAIAAPPAQPPDPEATTWIGVPDPDWGGTIGNPITFATPAFPDPWTSDTAGFYYVQPDDAQCDNTGNGHPGGGVGAARCVLPYNTLSAGDVVVMHGSYAQNHLGGLSIIAPGTNTAPVIITTFDDQNPAHITQAWRFSGASGFFIVEGIHYDMSPNSPITSDPSRINLGGYQYTMLRNMRVTGVGSKTSTSGAAGENQAPISGTASNHVYYNNVIELGGNKNVASGDPDAHLISMAGTTNNVWIVGNDMGWTSGNAVQVCSGCTGGTPNTNAPSYIYLAGNTVHDTCQTGLWAKRGRFLIFSQNEVYNTRRNCPSDPAASGLGAQYGPDDTWFIFNTIHDTEAGINIRSASGGHYEGRTTITLLGNVVYNVHNVIGNHTANWRGDAYTQSGSCFGSWDSSGTLIIDNTCHDSDMMYATPSGGPHEISGNIHSLRDTAYATTNANVDIITGRSMDYNVLQEPYVNWGSPAYTNCVDINANVGTGNVCEDPLYEDAANQDFRLTSTSPARDAGPATLHQAYTDFFNTFGISIAVDHAGNPRLVGSNVDIGAFEYQ